MDLLEISGLPLHPLIVHAVVVLLPLTACALLLGTFVPAARRRLGVVTPIASLVVLALVPITIAAGESLKEVVGALPSVQHHEMLGRMLPPWAIALFIVAAAQWAWFRFRPRPANRQATKGDRATVVVFAVAATVVAVGSTVMVILIGEAGARAVWGG
ncbi:hypothetical protein DC31_09020 [Microbacterium sp. CH12i]|uniref:DUF2231 domain-containing protein n=1 Tax=Microbacterium sp. CH12i TaxID=1479651 RepID=UPI0004613F8E|nr:DUF2231 domain-containing protein [Microbacterium sp. CH12i]KDA06535.1 hypothetical protein DC31_09020 [Microbacterium sp. CH12i]